MTIVYIAGPMSGIDEFNYPAFHDAASRWRAHGFAVLNPAEHFDGDTTLPYGTYLREAFRSLVDADAVAVLPGWEHSPGAQLEVAFAQKVGMRIYSALDMSELR